MDAVAQLALMAKAKLVFENPGTFLSFPALSPISYKAADLDFDLATATAAKLSVLSEFSRLVNTRPDGTIFQMDEPDYLWDTYREVLNGASLARAAPTPAGEAAHQQAMNLLTVVDADGLVSDSPVMLRYKQYRDAFFKASEAYKSGQFTAAATSDAAVKAQWAGIDEARLREAMQMAEADCHIKGRKAEVDAALQVLQTHAASAPETTWRAWASQFDPAIDILTDTATQVFPLTSYSPHGVFDQDWPTFRISKEEIHQLAADAPPELKAIFASDGLESDLLALSFEYRSVRVERPWFSPELFSARFWRLPDGAGILSDGAAEPEGICPAYVSALVFVRNISVTMRAKAAATAPALQVPSLAFPALSGRPHIVLKPRVAHTPILPRRPQATPPVAGPVLVPRIRPRIVLAPRPNAAVAAGAALPSLKLPDTLMLRRLRSVSFTPLPARAAGVTAPSSPTPPPPPAPDTVTQVGARDDISILAFICKRIPKSPDPDPALRW